MSQQDITDLIEGMESLENTPPSERKYLYEKKKMRKIYDASKKYEIIEIAGDPPVTSSSTFQHACVV